MDTNYSSPQLIGSNEYPHDSSSKDVSKRFYIQRLHNTGLLNWIYYFY